MCIAFYSHDHDSQRFFPRWCDLNPTGTGFCVSAYRSIQLFRRESALISVRAPSSSYPVVCFSLGTWIVSVARNFQTWSNGDKKMRVWVILGIVLIPRNVLFFSFSVLHARPPPSKHPPCVFSRRQIVYMISNMILVLSKGIICLTSGVMCYVWLTYGYAKGEGVSNIAFPLVLSMMFGYFVVKLSLLNAVSILYQCCVNTVSTLF